MHRWRLLSSLVVLPIAPLLIVLTVGLMDFSLSAGSALAAQVDKKAKSKSAKSPPAVSAAQLYVEAVASGDRVAAGLLDFACQFKIVAASPSRLKTFPPSSDPVYSRCWEQLVSAHQRAVEQRELGVLVMWPGKGALVFFAEDLASYAPSFFVMDLLGLSPPAGGLRVEPLDSKPLPAASFRLREDAPLVAAPATLVRLRVTYKDPLTSPVTYAPGAYKWANTVKRPLAALKTVTLKWVVLSGLRKLGFPGDQAVVNLPVTPATDNSPAVPFVTETGGYGKNSAIWWGPTDAPGVLIAAVGRATQFPDLRERLAMLNRVLIIDPNQPDALTALTRDLYQAILNDGAATHRMQVGDEALAARFNEFYWNTYSQTTRMEISLGMEMGGLSKPTPADYLYRMIPAMEKLAQVRPEDLENRFRLGNAYRWNNDQLAAIATHEALLKQIPPERAAIRARALIELAWSKIAKVAWNRIFDDPIIVEAYKEAEEAFKLTDRPVDKFAAAYTMAYSLAFTPNRDNRAMLDHLTEARRWYLQVGGASPDSWRYLLANDTLKGLVESDPAFQSLLAAGDRG
ncbi:MAG TPA: hypothetical protein VFL31_05835 [Nitrospiraceae bacterium]|nr:hypothetical protein [Nitrospiraceae bacterium]